MTQRSTARYISQKPRAGHRSDGKKELLTDLRSSSRAHGGIHFASIWHRTVAFVVTLLTFCGASEVNVQRPGYYGVLGGTRTWPPGPELRAKLKSTRFRGTATFLNACNHSRASALSALVSRLDRAGGIGSVNLGAFA